MASKRKKKRERRTNFFVTIFFSLSLTLSLILSITVDKPENSTFDIIPYTRKIYTDLRTVFSVLLTIIVTKSGLQIFVINFFSRLVARFSLLQVTLPFFLSLSLSHTYFYYLSCFALLKKNPFPFPLSFLNSRRMRHIVRFHSFATCGVICDTKISFTLQLLYNITRVHFCFFILLFILLISFWQNYRQRRQRSLSSCGNGTTTTLSYHQIIYLFHYHRSFTSLETVFLA